MRLHSYIITILACLLSLLVQAQNTPILTETAPAGSPTDSIASDLSVFSSSGGLNYVRTFIPKVPISDISNVTESSPAAAVQVSTLYKDGFLRDIMGIQRNFIDVNGQVKALVQPIPASFLPGSQSYLPYTATSGGFASLAFAQQKSYYLGMYPGEQSQSFGATQYLSNDTMRAAVSYAPGLSQIGQGRGTTTRQITNAAYQVTAWKINSSGMPVSDGAYAANELFGTRTTGSQGLEITEFKDKDGRLVSRTVLQNTIVSPPDITQVRGTTTYIYDKKGQLRYIFPPRVSAYASGSPSQTVIDNMCYSYFYENGLLTGQRFPGQAAPTWIIYDQKLRPVMRQSALEKARDQWEVTFYDNQGRVKATALMNSTLSRPTWQGWMDAGSSSTDTTELLYYLLTQEGEDKYPGDQSITDYDLTMMSYNYYDDYSRSDVNNDFWYAYDNTLQIGAYVGVNGGETPSRSYATQGRVTGSRVRILASPSARTEQTGEWRENAVFYDQKGRVFYTASRDLYQGNVIHATLNGSLYDFSNKVLFSKQVLQHGQSQDGSNEHTEVTRYDYDMMTGRPTRTRHSMDGGGWQDLGRLQYDGMGRVRRNIIGNYSEVQDQDYNIRGQLTGINATYAETGNKEGENRTFGESLKYDYGFAQARYDGKIAGMIWRGAGGASAKANAYGYTYDNSGRLTGADYYRREPAGGSYLTPAWRKDLADYSVSGLNYDLDGNIRDMIQMGVVSGGVTELDNLHYTYDATGSQLLHVSDDVTTDYGLGDFQDGYTGPDDYNYDRNGNLAKDENKGIGDVIYTHFNKPSVVTFKSGSIEYSYDAAGNKVQELIITGDTKRTDYIGNFVYTNDTVQYALTGSGRTTFKITGTGITNKEEFFVKDHLGNVRSVTDLYTYPVEEYLAGYEIASANLENLFFERIDEVRDDKPGSTWIDDLKSARLNGGDPSRRIGTSLLVHVMAGDMVEMNVNNFYDGYNPADDAPLDPATMLSSIAGTLTGGSGGYVGGEQHNTSLVSSVFNSTNYTAFDAQVKAGTDTSKPRAYLNYLLFDESKQLVSSMSGSFQANGNGTWTAIGTTQPLTVPQNGYLAVYLSNSTHVTGCLNCGDVFFDQLVFRLSRGNLKEENHYYPFGLPIAGLSSTAPDLKEQRRKYQSNEYIKDLGLNWMDFHARQYDPQIGRFLGVDPKADYKGQEIWNPYAAMGNAPESMIDPNGESANSFSDYDKIARALSALTTSYGDGIFVNGNFISNKDLAIGLFKEVMAQAAGGGCLMSNEFLERQSNEIWNNLQSGIADYFFSPEKGGKKKSGALLFELKDYNSYFDPKAYIKGLRIELWYKGSVAGYEKTDWIQSVTTSYPDETRGKADEPYMDGDREYPNPPFYFGKNEGINFYRHQMEYNNDIKWFTDAPYREPNAKDYYWMAELSLVGLKNGKWENIITFSWGFLHSFKFIIPLPFFVKQPSTFQKSLFNYKKK